MRYKNKLTGIILETSNKMGNQWELLCNNKELTKEKSKDIKKKKRKYKENKQSSDFITVDGMTVSKVDIIQELDAFGIKYDNNLPSKELYKLLIEAS